MPLRVRGLALRRALSICPVGRRGPEFVSGGSGRSLGIDPSSARQPLGLCVPHPLWGCLESMGMGGRVSAFLKAVYTGMSSEVKVGEERIKTFRVACGLRQGCILSPHGVVHQSSDNSKSCRR